MQELMPYVRRKTDDVLIRLDVYYAQILAIKFGIGVDEDGNALRPNDAQQKLTREIFGDRVIAIAPKQWYYAEAFLTAEMLPHKWESTPIHSRARWMAAKRIDNMVQALTRYRETIERKNKEALAKQRANAAKHTPRGRR